MRMKQMHRRILEGCLACLLCFTCSIPAFAAETATPSNADERREILPDLESDAPGTLESKTPEASEEVSLVLVTEIQNEDELLSLPDFTLPLRTTPSDDDLEEIYQLALRYQTVCATVTAGEEIRQETFSVAWDFSAIDQTTPGEYTAAGRIELPEGYAFGEAVLQELQISVRVKEMPPAVITSIEKWYPYTDALAVQQGSETETLENLFSFSPYYLECYAENGTSYTAVVEWDFSGIDLNTVGLYHAAGRLTAPENTIFADRVDFPEISIPVSVQAPGSPDINCFLVRRGSLYFPWVTPPGNLDKVSIWLSENNGSWNRLESGVYVGQEMLSIATRLLAPTAFKWIMTADRPASCPLPTQMKLSLKGIMKATGMEGMQAGIHPIPSFNRLLKIPTIRMTVSQTGPPQSLQNRLQQMAAEWIPTILKKHHLSVKKMILRIMNHPTSLPSHPWRERMIP